eukprot:scaffold37565_cov74-Phaeocystis_antarctica.AAC.1
MAQPAHPAPASSLHELGCNTPPGTRQLQPALPRGKPAAAALAAVRGRHRHSPSQSPTSEA